MPEYQRQHLEILLGFIQAAQTITAAYGSPNGPTDPMRYYEVMTGLLDDRDLLQAQLVLTVC